VLRADKESTSASPECGSCKTYSFKSAISDRSSSDTSRTDRFDFGVPTVHNPPDALYPATF